MYISMEINRQPNIQIINLKYFLVHSFSFSIFKTISFINQSIYELVFLLFLCVLFRTVQIYLLKRIDNYT